ncbi:MAG: glycosyltransferase [Terriglobales bacterium]|jgi:glycosyltransferase involved in cell wall biosynthesis
MRSERLHVGLIGLDLWLGGATYVHNLIRALVRLPDEERPRITLFCQNRFDLYEEVLSLVDKVVRYRTWPADVLGNRVLTRVAQVSKGFVSANCFGDSLPELSRAVRKERVDCVFPVCESHAALPNPIDWIPDVQHCLLPENFPWFTRRIRDRKFAAQLNRSGGHVVFSSRSALSSAIGVYGVPRATTHILRFVTVPEASWYGDPAPVMARHKIPARFFIVCDQFWIHKDHATAFRAVAKLAREGRKIHLVCTGPVTDHHHPGYVGRLKAEIRQLGIESQVQILGTLPRPDQMALVRASQAVVQPSQFEGWSSIVEEAKAFGKAVILTDHPVHQEQAAANFFYFRAGDFADCARAIGEFSEKQTTEPFEPKSHDIRMADFARTFMGIAYQATGAGPRSVYQQLSPGGSRLGLRAG